MPFPSWIGRRGGRRAPRDADAAALRKLQARGADLTRPRHVVHLLSFPSEEGARAAAEEAARAGWACAVSPPGERDAGWSLRAEAYRVLDASTARGFRALFERLADAHGGAYDGWEAAREP